MPTELKFHEKMTGYFARGETDPRTGYERGRKEDTTFGFELTIATADLDAFTADPEHQATVTGRYLGTLFPDSPIVQTGTFQFMSKGPGASRLMVHRHTFVSKGMTYEFYGEKDIDDDPLAVDMIQDLTTLYSRITDASGAVVAAGILRFPMIDFPRLVASFETHGDEDPLSAKMKFLLLFLREEVHVLLSGWEKPPAPANVRRILSKPHGEIAAKYDVVVVGTGYGGGVAAARLASWRNAGRHKSVCVLERGREWRAGDFPAEPWQLGAKSRSVMNPEGLFDFHFGRDINVLVGNGLGGTSLINANAMIVPEPDCLEKTPFPAGLPRLEPYLQRALATMGAAKNPSAPLKSSVFRKAASATDGAGDVDLAPITVTFQKTTRDDTGNVQDGCTDCGGCVTGCNFTAKNSTDMNFLSIAEKQGAAIFTGMEVLSILPSDASPHDTFTLRVYDHDTHTARNIDASQVVLAAGTLGTFKILAQSRVPGGLKLSDQLGQGFSGNGDVLGFGYNSDEQTDVDCGPTINSIAHFRTDPDPTKHFVIEEGGIPRALMAIVRDGLTVLKDRGIDTDHGWLDALREWLRVQADRIGLENLGALNHTLVYLSVGREERLGTMVLDGDRVRIDWPGVADLPFAKRVNEKMLEITAKVGGTAIKNPDLPIFPLDRMFTVHPLGGCAMGTSPSDGVVNVRGEVFGYEKRLFVADGSILPGPIGVNPALTIAALSEWISEGIQAGWA